MDLLSPAASAYVQAVNNGNIHALVDSFATTAEILDVTRLIVGSEAIEVWARNEVIGGKLKIIGAANYNGGQDLLVHFTPPRSTVGFNAHYRFDIKDNVIVRANLQYA